MLTILALAFVLVTSVRNSSPVYNYTTKDYHATFNINISANIQSYRHVYTCKQVSGHFPPDISPLELFPPDE